MQKVRLVIVKTKYIGNFIAAFPVASPLLIDRNSSAMLSVIVQTFLKTIGFTSERSN